MDSFEKELMIAIGRQASDLYILPFADSYRILMAVRGKVTVTKNISSEEGKKFISFLKYRANMAVSEHRRPQLGAFRLDEQEKVNIRLSSVGDYQGRESMVVRFIYQLKHSEFRFLIPEQWKTLKSISKNRGLILFAGPMGSGKTTTMYQLAKSISMHQVVMSIEDPVEVDEPEFIQLQVNELAGMDYQSLLKLGLRHRPDTFIIGEIRDSKTAMMTVQAALSGHLVLGTIHAQNAYGVVARLQQLGVEKHYLQQALTAICYQRLLPCKKEQAVLCDLLCGEKLIMAIENKQRGKVTNEWVENLNKGIKEKQISKEVAERYKQG